MPGRRWFALLLPLLIATGASPESLIEESRYEVYFAFIKVGIVETKLYRRDNGSYKIQSQAYTVGIADRIYPIRDKITSIFNSRGSVSYSSSIKEGKRYFKDRISFYQSRGVFEFYRNGRLRGRAQFEPPLFDSVSVFYAHRDNICGASGVKVTDGQRIGSLKVVCKRKENSTIVEATLPVKSFLFLRDERRPVVIEMIRDIKVPVKSRIPTAFGSITLKLTRYQRWK